MKQIKWSALFLCFAIMIMLVSCENQGAEKSVYESSSEQTENTLSSEEREMVENQKFLETVTYLDYVLTGETAPYFVGRWFEKEINGESHHVTLTDGSAIYFLVDGAESFDMNFTVITSKEEPYFAYSIDGGEPTRQHITEKTVHLPDNGKHTVRIIADGMTESEGKWKEEKGFALKSVIPSEGGKIYGIRPENKIIFYYGDSITEGVRALNMSATSNGNSAVNAYPWFCSEKLGAVTYSVGYGASGVTVSGSFHTFRNAIDYNSNGREVEDGVIPDVIVINHGTNDRGANAEAFKAELFKAIVRLREKYPDTPIVYMIPFGQYQAQAITEAMDHFENAYVVQTDEWNITFTDVYHPDSNGAKIAGENLAEELICILGEDFFS